MFEISASELNHYGILEDWKNALIIDRKELFTADATRSLILIVIAAALIALPYLRKEFRSDNARKILTGCVIVVVLFDLWGVGKRYLNSDNFKTESEITEKYFSESDVDRYILQDPDPNFRVLDIDHLYSSIPSYHHKCIGGSILYFKKT
jgi:hypothetical protein